MRYGIRESAIAFCISLTFAVIFFSQVAGQRNLLWTSDSNVGSLAFRKDTLPQAFAGSVSESPLLGNVGARPLHMSNLLLWALPLQVFNDGIYALCLGLGSLGVLLFLRRRGVPWIGASIGCLAAFWAGSNLTLTAAGHIGKFPVLAMSGLILLLTDWMVAQRRVSGSILVGLLFGLMFGDQQDLALFFALMLGSYIAFRVFLQWRWDFEAWLKLLLPIPVVLLLIAAPPMLRSYQVNIESASVTSAAKPVSEQWDYCTQWSFPPTEVMDLLAPGYMGWKSNDSEAPYWGRTGQTPGWDEHRRGFRNFRIESVYLGIVPILLALGSLVLYSRRRTSGPKSDGGEDGAKAEVWFWGIAAALTMLLSFGRFFPLYRLFWQLPVVHSIRNPNKFLQVFQLCIGILAAYGYKASFARRHATAGVWWIAAAGGSAALLAVWAVVIQLGAASWARVFTERGWQAPQAEEIVSTMSSGLWRAALLAAMLCAAAYIARRWGMRMRALIPTLGCLLLLVSVLDMRDVTARYLTVIDGGSLEQPNEIITFLKENLGSERFAFLSQDGIYGNWLGVLFPYHGLHAVNIVQAPRMAGDYHQLLSALSQNPVRLWELTSVKYVIAPTPTWEQLQKHPDLSVKLSEVARFVSFSSGGGLAVRSVDEGRPSHHVLLELTSSPPRFNVPGKCLPVESNQVLGKVAAKSFSVRDEVLMASESLRLDPVIDGKGLRGLVSSVDKLSRGYEIDVTMAAPGVLVFSQKFQPDWVASVDGVPVPVERCNFLCMGVQVPAGQHKVVIQCRSKPLSILLQCVGSVICLGAVMGLVILKR